MRTTLTIDDDVLLAAKDLARRQKRTAGAVISELARRGLICRDGIAPAAEDAVFGFEPFPGSGAVVTDELIDRLRDDESV